MSDPSPPPWTKQSTQNTNHLPLFGWIFFFTEKQDKLKLDYRNNKKKKTQMTDKERELADRKEELKVQLGVIRIQ